MSKQDAEPQTVSPFATEVTQSSPPELSHNQQVGCQGETIACQMLADHGWEIIDRNWRCRTGEIDIIAAKGRHLAFIEVKTRSSTAFGSGAEAVTTTKVKRMRKLAVLWLQAQNQYWSLVSLDVIEVAIRPSQPALLRFIRSVG